MLTVDRLSVHYGAIRGVVDVSMNVREGEIVSLVGANGAGKTTTLAAIFGLVRATSGDVLFGGASLLGQQPEARVRAGLALVPEGRRIFGRLTVEENLAVAARVCRDSATRRTALSRTLAAFPILRELSTRPAGKLSGGEQQQLAIGRALVSSPRLLALDEPSLGLAPQICDVVFDKLADLRDEGITILLVEQNAARAAALADRTYVLRNGAVALEVRREQIGDIRDFASHYLGGSP